METENKLGVMPVSQLVLSMTVPIMISMLAQSMYNIVDSIFVSRISEDALTAASLAYSAQMLQIAVAVGTGVGTNALVSRRMGAGDRDGANEAATTGLVLTVLSSLLFVLWGLFGSRAFIGLFTDEPAILDSGTSYLRICQLFATGIFLGTFFQRILQSVGRTMSSMCAQLAGALTNLILDPILIFGLLGCPELGIAGAAIATVIGQWVAAFMGLALLIAARREIRFVFRGFRMRRDNVKYIYKVGFPTILTQAFGSIMVALMNKTLFLFSSTAVAFFGVYFKLQSFLFMPLNGMGQGSLPVVSYNLGARRTDRIRECVRVTVRNALVLAAVATAVFLCLPETLLDAFAASDEMKAIGIPALRIICLTFPLTAVTMMCGYTISGLGSGLVNMISTALRQCVVLLPCVLLLDWLSGIRVIWFAFWVAEAAALAFALYQLRRRMAALPEG